MVFSDCGVAPCLAGAGEDKLGNTKQDVGANLRAGGMCTVKEPSESSLAKKYPHSRFWARWHSDPACTVIFEGDPSLESELLFTLE